MMGCIQYVRSSLLSKEYEQNFRVFDSFNMYAGDQEPMYHSGRFFWIP